MDGIDPSCRRASFSLFTRICRSSPLLIMSSDRYQCHVITATHATESVPALPPSRSGAASRASPAVPNLSSSDRDTCETRQAKRFRYRRVAGAGVELSSDNPPSAWRSVQVLQIRAKSLESLSALALRSERGVRYDLLVVCLWTKADRRCSRISPTFRSRAVLLSGCSGV